jgi:hypothetical protein
MAAGKRPAMTWGDAAGPGTISEARRGQLRGGRVVGRGGAAVRVDRLATVPHIASTPDDPPPPDRAFVPPGDPPPPPAQGAAIGPLRATR